MPTTPVALPVLLVAAALAAWIVTVERMRGMDAGPGADLGGLAAFVGIWVTMMAAMMLPAVLPMVLLYARIARQRGGSTAVFLASYLLVWSALGVAAYLAARAIRAIDPGWLAWDTAGGWLAGGAIAAAGIYQLTPLKSVCLRHCRGPLHFVMGGWRDGSRGALRMGFEHGGWCVGCCAGLMLALFALGVMSLVWMTVVAATIFAEKVLPGGERLARGVALALVALGLWVAIAPRSVPGLAEPGSAPMQMTP